MSEVTPRAAGKATAVAVPCPGHSGGLHRGGSCAARLCWNPPQRPSLGAQGALPRPGRPCLPARPPSCGGSEPGQSGPRTHTWVRVRRPDGLMTDGYSVIKNAFAEA